eukprot:TRINITY_DN11716_c0_g1_i1.p1 TRINITY_DN11716_c0_g1~~TRINITY_DN11716_c0_g1_i1.p1  ORF type:complete len:535 (-),score=99.85 TRINITY_DN11716_c0_g1_i1:22-1626(-)
MFSNAFALFLFVVSASGEVCNLIGGPSPLFFDDPKNWDCGHVPNLTTDVVVSLNQDYDLVVASNATTVSSLTITGQANQKSSLRIANATFSVLKSLTCKSTEIRLTSSTLSVGQIASSSSSLNVFKMSTLSSSSTLNLDSLMIQTQIGAKLTINASVKTTKDCALHLYLPVARDTNASFSQDVQIDFGDNTWDAASGSVKLVLSADKTIIPKFHYAYHLIEGSNTAALGASVSKNLELKTLWPQATVTVNAVDDYLTLTYVQPGKAYSPENTLLAYYEEKGTSGDYWINVNWQESQSGACDPDMVFKGTVLNFFPADQEFVYMNKTASIKYPLSLKKKETIIFTAMVMCYATDGETEFHTNSSLSQSPQLLVVIPLLPPQKPLNETEICATATANKTVCTILFTVPKYECSCDGEVDYYELNTTCLNFERTDNATFTTLNCTTDSFVPAVSYRAACNWSIPNAPSSDLSSVWSTEGNLTVLLANITSVTVPRTPMPLWVIILCAVFLGIGVTIMVAVLIYRATRNRNHRYELIQ